MATEASDNWVQVFEIPFNQTVNVLGDDSVNIVDTTITSGNVANLYDRDLTSAFSPDSVNDGDTLTYAMNSIINVGSLMIMQDPTAISNATVSVKDIDGSWSDIGTLDNGTNTFNVNKNILEVKLTFHEGNPTPVIYEIIVKERVDAEETNKDALAIAVELADEVTEEELQNVVPIVVAEFRAAHNYAKEVLSDSLASQETIDLAFTRLANAMHMLEFYKGDKTELQALVTRVEKLEEGNYTSESWAPFKEALDAAIVVIGDDNAKYMGRI